MTVHADDITDECASRDHGRCSGWAGSELDPDLCNCQCHDDMAAALYGEDES